MFGFIARLYPNFSRKTYLAICFTILSVIISGCAATTPPPKGPVFFPPPPDLPRVQYLTSISSSDDLVEKKWSFWLWLIGKGEQEQTVSIFKPYGLTVHKGRIFVCDIAGRVIIIDPGNRSFTFLDGKRLRGMKKPLNVAFDASDNMYVADIENKQVLVYDPGYNFLRDIGKDIPKLKPADVAVDNEFIYVLDMAGNEIKLFDLKTGELVRSIGKSNEKTGLALPTSMSLDSHGSIYVTNITTANVVKLDRDGHVLGTFGKLGDSFGDFARPKGIAVDPEGRIFVVDNGMQQVDIFNEAGRLLLPFGAPGLTTGSMNLPVGIAVTRDLIPFFNRFADPSFVVDSLVFVTNQYGNDKVMVYGVGHKQGVDYDIYSKPAAQQKTGPEPNQK